MFEAKFENATTLKRVLDAIKDLVTDVNWDCSSQGITLQAMDSSHVSLVSLVLTPESVEEYRCDNNMSLGINMASMTKIMKCADNNDRTILRAEPDSDIVTFVFENSDKDKLSEYEMKLMDIDSEHLGIPDQTYGAVVRMPSAEFQRIIRDLSTIGESVEISVSKEGISFTASGDTGKGTVNLKHNPSVDEEDAKSAITIELEGEEVKLNFAVRYLNFFTKATSLSDSVTLSMSPEHPLSVEYQIGEENGGYVRYYLAPKIEEEEDED
jgi:proliferating cell nuclear antigen